MKESHIDLSLLQNMTVNPMNKWHNFWRTSQGNISSNTAEGWKYKCFQLAISSLSSRVFPDLGTGSFRSNNHIKKKRSKSHKNSVGVDMGQREPSFTIDRNVAWLGLLGKCYSHF